MLPLLAPARPPQSASPSCRMSKGVTAGAVLSAAVLAASGTGCAPTPREAYYEARQIRFLPVATRDELAAVPAE